MKFERPDSFIVTGYEDDPPIDMNDPEGAASAIELTLPTGFSEKAHACWKYFEGGAFLFEYKGMLVVTDESLYLTEHGDGSHDAPIGFPRWVCESWDELEKQLENCYDDLMADDPALMQEIGCAL